jgi:hypothetical protein
MNDAAIRQQRAGFLYNETLGTKLKFSGHLMVWEKDKVTKHTADGEFQYWVVKDEYGARLTCHDEKLADFLKVSQRYAVTGEIKIGKGGTFLNLKNAEVLKGGDFRDDHHISEVTRKVD